ncbi:MAG: hypothetical protein ACLFVO_16140 [Chloroflexaceae bacterium]
MSNISFEPADDPEVEQLAAAIDQARDGNPLLFDVLRLNRDDAGDAGEQPDYPALLDAFVALFDYTGLAAHWIELRRGIARKLLIHVLHEGLAYPEEMMDKETAEACAERFLEFFAPGTRYFTNGTCSGEAVIYTLAGQQVLGWRPISSATFDNGVIAVSSDRIGIVWAEDED